MKTLLLVLVVLAACTPSNVTPPPDADDAARPTGCIGACAAMRAAGCPEGAAANCAQTCAHVVASGLTPIDTACLSRATGVGEVRACGVRCER